MILFYTYDYSTALEIQDQTEDDDQEKEDDQEEEEDDTVYHIWTSLHIVFL